MGVSNDVPALQAKNLTGKDLFRAGKLSPKAKRRKLYCFARLEQLYKTPTSQAPLICRVLVRGVSPLGYNLSLVRLPIPAFVRTRVKSHMGQPIGPWYGPSPPRKRSRSGPVLSPSGRLSGGVAAQAFGLYDQREGAVREELSRGIDGLDRDVVSDVADFYSAHPADEGLRRGCLDVVRVRRDRPRYLERRRAVATMFYDSEDDDDDDDEDNGSNNDIDAIGSRGRRSAHDGLAIVYVDTVDGVCWELGCWPDLHDPIGPDIFQIVLDVLTETVGACSISTIRVRDNLQSLQGICDGIDMLRHISTPQMRRGLHQANVNSFLHPITGETIEIIAAP
jgi:hypothetical protein